MKHRLSKALAALLALVMVLSLLPVTAFAAEGSDATVINGMPADGAYGVIFSCGEGYAHVMGYDIAEGNAPALEVALTSDGTGIETLPDGTAVVKFVKTGSDYYFCLGGKYLVLKDTSDGKEKLVLSDTAEAGAKWTIVSDQAGMTNAYNIKNAEYKWNGTQDVYLEQYNGQKFCGYSYKSSTAQYFQFRFFETEANDTGRVGEIAAPAALPENGDTVVIYNDYAKAVFGQPAVGAAKPNLSGASAELRNGTLSYDDIGDGGLIFQVSITGSGDSAEYSFKTGDKYLGMTENYVDESGKTVNDESLILIDTETDYAKWTVSQINGGWLMKNKAATWKSYPVYIEYFDDLFCGYSYDSSRQQIFAMNFYKVTDRYGTGYVVNPAVVYAEGLYAAIGTDCKITYTVDDLNDLTATTAKYWFDDSESGAKTAEVTYENKVGSFTIPAVELVGHTTLHTDVTLTDSMALTFSGKKTLEIVDEPQILDVTPAPNAATGADNFKPLISAAVTNVGEGASFELKLDDQAVAYTSTVALNPESGLYEGVISYTPTEDLAEGKHTLFASVTRADGKTVLKNWVFFVGESGETLYFGQIHAHTAEYSDGAGTLEQAYEHAHEVDDLDYIIITDHSNYFDTTATATTSSYYDLSSLSKNAEGSMTKWEEARKTAEEYNALYDDFICAYGYEMTWSGGPGHTNSFNTFGVVSRNNASLNAKTNHAGMFLYNDLMVNAEKGLDVDGNSIGVEKTKYIADAPVVSQFNHPGKTFGNFGDFAGYSAQRDDVLNLVEVGNGEGKVGGSSYFPSYEQYDLALSKGWHVGPTNNQDNHKGKWGDGNTCRDVILTDDFTEAGIYRALDQRRIYSTEDQNLEIYYTLSANGVDYKLGDIAPLDKNNQPETVIAKLTVNEPDRENISKIQVIGEGARVLKEISVGANSYQGEITVANESGYYYIKVVEADGDIAVTAPVWTSETVPVSLDLSTDSAVAAQGVEEHVQASLVNASESEAVTINSYRITAEGSVIAESTEAETLPAGQTKALSIPFTPSTTDPSEKKTYEIKAEFTFTYKGSQSTYEKTLTETSYPPEMMTYIGLDRGHTNFYVSGDYANNETSFIQICADNGIIVEYINAGQMTAENLAKYKMVVLTVPRKSETEAPTVWTEDELAAIAAYANAGGNIINLSKSDRYDYDTTTHSSAYLSNQINEAVGSNVRFAKGIVVDNEKKSNEAYRINFNGAERLGDHLFTRGISLSTNGEYQYYNGTGLITLEGKEDQVTGLVKPYDSTWIASYKANFTGSAYVPDYEKDTVVAPKGTFNLITCEQLAGGGFMVCGGACFISNYDLKTGMSISEQYVNYGLVMNILRYIRDGEDSTVITPIADVHAYADANGGAIENNPAIGTEYTVEGIITSNASDYDKDTAFFDCIYVQDETRGINVFPVSGYYFIGEKVRVHGAITYYCGEIELNLQPEYHGSIEIVSNDVTPLTPKDVTCAEAMDDSNIGNLVRVTGTITDIHKTEGVVDYVYVQDDTGTATLFINNYIQKDYKGLDDLAVGMTVVGTGIGSRDADENDQTGSTFIRRLRVRSRYEIYDPENPPVILDKTALQEAIAAAEALNQAEYTEESWAAVASALAAAKTALQTAGSQEELDAAAEALNAAVAALEKKPVQPAAEAFVLTTELKDGDEVVVFHPTSQKALGKTLDGKKVTAIDAAVVDETLTPTENVGIYTVEYVDETNFLLKQADGTYLTSAPTGNGMSFEAEANEYSQWYLQVIDEAAGTVGIRSTNAAYNNNKNQALEYYNGFTTYGWKDNNNAYIFQLFIKPAPELFRLNTQLKQGNEVIIYHPTSVKAMGKALDGKKVAASSDVTIAEDVLTPAEDGTTGIYTVEYVDETNFLLKQEDGTYLTSAPTGNGMSFEAEANEYSQWYLQVIDEAAGTVGVRSTNAAYNGNKNQALEYYNGFTTYGWKDNNNAYIFQLYVKGQPEAGLKTRALQAAIAEAEALDAEDYTEESWAAVQSALAAARAALENATTQEELDAAAQALNDAVAALERKPASADWVLTPIGEIQPEDEVVIVFTKNADQTSYGVANDKGASAAPTAVPVTVSEAKAVQKLAVDPDPNLVWNITVAADSTFVVRPNGDAENALYCLNSSNNGIRVGTNEANVFEIDRASGYMVHHVPDTETTRYLGIYNNQDLRAYTSINNNIKDQTVSFFVKREAQPVNAEFEFLVTSDLHGQIYATDYTLPYEQSGTYKRGLTRVATYIKEQKAAYGDNLYTVDMGDTFQGAPLTYYYAFNKPEEKDPAILAFRTIGYDMWVVGNHEFNYGLPILTRQMDYAVSPSTDTEKQLTISMANYLKAETNNDETKDWATWRDVTPYVIKDFGGYKVAIIGFGNPNIPKWDVPANWEGIYFADIIETYKHYEAEMLEQADMIVVVAHSGIGSDEGSDFMERLVNQTNTIAFAFSGHEHGSQVYKTTNLDGKEVPILQPYTKARAIAQVKVTVDNGKYTIVPEIKNMENYPIDENLAELLRPYEVDTWENYMLQPIGKALGDYPAANLGTAPSAFMDLINEVQTWGAYDRTGENTPDKPEDDVRPMLSISAPLTSGSKENLIPEGDIYLGDMFGLYRFENWFYQITMTGEEVHQWLEFAATKVRVDDQGAPYVTNGDLTYYDVIYGDGFHYDIDVSQPEGQRVVNMKYNGEPVAADQVFTVVVNNYRYNGGGNYVKWLNEHGCTFVANDPDRIIYSTQYDMIQGEDEGQARALLVSYIKEQTAANGGITPSIVSDWRVLNGIPADKTELEAAITAAEGVDKSLYTDETVAALEEALAAAKEIDEKEDATQEEVDAAKEALEAAVAALAEKPIDKTGLEAAITAAEGVDKSLYTDETVAALEEALAAAKAVSEKEDATQAEIDAAKEALEAAVAALEEKPIDKTALDEVIAEGEALYEDDFTAETWAPFEAAIRAAIKVQEDPKATQEEVDAAAAALRAALDALKPIPEAPGPGGLADIDFTTTADADKYEIYNQSQSEVEEGEGLALIATTQAFEDCKTQLSGDQATTPADVVMVPVAGDWTATLTTDFSVNGASNGYYQFFGFYASMGDDFQNMCGIRGGDGAMQNFIREDGTITHQDEEDVNSTPGFAADGTYYLRIAKVGTTYTCYRSEDGEAFTEMFAYEDTGIEAAYIVIDAYTGMTQNYMFTLKSLDFEGGAAPAETDVDRSVLEKAIADAEAAEKDKYTDASVEALEKALEAGRKAMKSSNQDAVNEAARNLRAAINGLQEKPLLDPCQLEQAIANSKTVDTEGCTEASLKALEDAVAAAEKALAEATTQEELDKAAKALNDAIQGLEKQPELDAEALEAAIEEAKKADTEGCTEESVKALEDAIEAAEKALEEAKTQEELDAAKQALDEAVAGLEKVKPPFRFDDVQNEDDYYYEPVYWAYNHDPQITTGTDETHYSPEDGCTRAQVVTFLWRADGKPGVGDVSNPFKDVAEGEYYYDAVLWAVENGITTGTEVDQFSPEETCTRAQIVTFLWRYEGKPAPASEENPFKDVAEGEYYYDAVLWAVGEGITKGTEADAFSPSDTCTRAQIVTFLFRDLKKKEAAE